MPSIAKYCFAALIVYIPKVDGLISKWHFSSFFWRGALLPAPVEELIPNSEKLQLCVGCISSVIT